MPVTDNFIAFMRHFARHTDQHSALYNAAKHGFAVKPGSAHLLIGAEGEEDGTFFQRGPSLAFLEQRKVEKGVYEYTLTTQWLNLVETWALTYCGLLMLSNLWHVGRWRFLDVMDEYQQFRPAGEDENPTGIKRDSYAATGSGYGKLGMTSVRVKRER